MMLRVTTSNENERAGEQRSSLKEIFEGKKSRDKVIAIEGLADDEVNAALQDAVKA